MYNWFAWVWWVTLVIVWAAKRFFGFDMTWAIYIVSFLLFWGKGEETIDRVVRTAVREEIESYFQQREPPGDTTE